MASQTCSRSTRTTLGDLVPGLEKEPPCARANKRRKLNAEDSGDDEMRDDYNGQANGEFAFFIYLPASSSDLNGKCPASTLYRFPNR